MYSRSIARAGVGSFGDANMCVIDAAESPEPLWLALRIDHAVLRRITDARTAFLDLDEASEVVAPVVTARAVDLEPPLPLEEVPAPKRRRGGQQPQLEV